MTHSVDGENVGHGHRRAAAGELAIVANEVTNRAGEGLGDGCHTD